MPAEQTEPNSYYELLGLAPVASVQQIRRAYRELSKLYHPDTTELPAAIATSKFQALNEAYATLSSPERRAAYDLKIGYSRVAVIQPQPNLQKTASPTRKYRSSAYLDPSDRPLSAGELFALFILGITFLGCLLLVFAIGMTRGEMSLTSLNPSNFAAQSVFAPKSSQSETTVPPQPSLQKPATRITPTDTFKTTLTQQAPEFNAASTQNASELTLTSAETTSAQ